MITIVEQGTIESFDPAAEKLFAYAKDKAIKKNVKLIIPKMAGFAFLDALPMNRQWHELPVIVVTARDLSQEDHRRLNGGVTAVLGKGQYSFKEITAVNLGRLGKYAVSTGANK